MPKPQAHIGVACLFSICSGLYSDLSTAGFNNTANRGATNLTAMIALTNATGNGSATGAKGGYAQINGTHAATSSKNISGRGIPDTRKPRQKTLSLLNPGHPSGPGNSSSSRGKHRRESSSYKSASRSRRQAGEPVPLSSSQNFTSPPFDCSRDYKQTATIDFSQSTPSASPLCNVSHPFTGEYASGAFGLENLTISKQGKASVFGRLRGADVQVNLFNVTL